MHEKRSYLSCFLAKFGINSSSYLFVFVNTAVFSGVGVIDAELGVLCRLCEVGWRFLFVWGRLFISLGGLFIFKSIIFIFGGFLFIFARLLFILAASLFIFARLLFIFAPSLFILTRLLFILAPSLFIFAHLLFILAPSLFIFEHFYLSLLPLYLSLHAFYLSLLPLYLSLNTFIYPHYLYTYNQMTSYKYKKLPRRCGRAFCIY